MEKKKGKKFVTHGKHREFYLGLNVATLCSFLIDSNEFITEFNFNSAIMANFCAFNNLIVLTGMRHTQYGFVFF